MTRIIVVDALSSKDNTEDICHQNNISYFKSPIAQRAAQMNLGALQGKSDIKFFLHADTQPPEDFQNQITESIKNGNDFGFFCYKFDKDKWYLKANAYFTKFKGIFCGGGDQGHFITKELFNLLKGYDDSYDIFEDYELYDRIKKSEVNIQIINSPAIVSARKYVKNSYLRINLINLISFIMYRLNFKPQMIKTFYSKTIRR